MHDCDVPNTGAKVWTCPVCRRPWTLTNTVSDTLTDLWHGRRNVRHPDGRKVRKVGEK
jgi:hypothetical protein